MQAGEEKSFFLIVGWTQDFGSRHCRPNHSLALIWHVYHPASTYQIINKIDGAQEETVSAAMSGLEPSTHSEGSSYSCVKMVCEFVRVCVCSLSICYSMRQNYKCDFNIKVFTFLMFLISLWMILKYILLLEIMFVLIIAYQTCIASEMTVLFCWHHQNWPKGSRFSYT